MTSNSLIDRYMSSGLMVVASMFLYIWFSYEFYEQVPTIFWLVSVFFVMFQAEHIYNFIGRNRYKSLLFLSGTIWHRLIACLIPSIIVAITWWPVSGL